MDLPTNETRIAPGERAAASLEAFNAMQERSAGQAGDQEHQAPTVCRSADSLLPSLSLESNQKQASSPWKGVGAAELLDRILSNRSLFGTPGKETVPQDNPSINTKPFDRGQVAPDSGGATNSNANAHANVWWQDLIKQSSNHPKETIPVQPAVIKPPAVIEPRPVPPEKHDPAPDANRRPLEPFARSGFHSEAEREKFEMFAAKKGFSQKAIRRAESMSREEWAAFDAINEDRSRNGRPLLQFSPRVKLVSDYQADRQAAARQMTHGNPGESYNPMHPYHLDRLKMVDLGVDGMHDGENAACGTHSGRAVTNMWLASSGHLRPIRDGFLKLGAVSCAQSSEGTSYWTFDASTGKERRKS